MSEKIGKTQTMKMTTLGDSSRGIVLPKWMRDICGMELGDELQVSLYSNEKGYHISIYKE